MQRGSALRLAGQGTKSKIGKTLIALGSLGALGNLETKPVEGILGGVLLGSIGAALVAGDKQKGSGIIDKQIKAALRKVDRYKRGQSGTGNNQLSTRDIKEIVKKYKDKPISVQNLFGDDWKEHGKTLLRAMKSSKSQKGRGLIGKAKKYALNKLNKFVTGKTKIKPSDLMNVTAGLVGLTGAASSLIPGINLISVPAAGAVSLGLRSAASLAKMKGLGVSLAGSGDLPPGVSYTKTGKIKRDRYSVFYGFHKKTKSGLTKEAFFLDGRKVKSKAKRAQGLASVKFLRQ